MTRPGSALSCFRLPLNPGASSVGNIGTVYLVFGPAYPSPLSARPDFSSLLFRPFPLPSPPPVGPLLFKAVDAPGYKPGLEAVMGIFAANIFCVLGLVAVFILANKRKEA